MFQFTRISITSLNVSQFHDTEVMDFARNRVGGNTDVNISSSLAFIFFLSVAVRETRVSTLRGKYVSISLHSEWDMIVVTVFEPNGISI